MPVLLEAEKTFQRKKYNFLQAIRIYICKNEINIAESKNDLK